MAFLPAMPNLDAADVERSAAGTPVLVEPYTGHGNRRAYVTDPDGDWLALVSKL
jgi:predicted enzyme related to lactoylglutathione lyase